MSDPSECGCGPDWRKPKPNGTCATCGGWLPGEKPPSLTAMWSGQTEPANPVVVAGEDQMAAQIEEEAVGGVGSEHRPGARADRRATKGKRVKIRFILPGDSEPIYDQTIEASQAPAVGETVGIQPGNDPLATGERFMLVDAERRKWYVTDDGLTCEVWLTDAARPMVDTTTMDSCREAIRMEGVARSC